MDRAKAEVLRMERDDTPAERYAAYRDDPVGFARDVLKVELVPKQREALECLLEPPFVVLCPSGNEQGKSLASAVAILWWHLTRVPSIVITTAPKYDQVKDILWKEVRRLARRAGLPVAFLPKTCRIERAPDDFAVGTTARDATSFQGHHGPSMLFVIDEATAVAAEMFEAIESMFSPPGHAMLCLYNPTDAGSRIYQEQTRAEHPRGGKPAHIVRMSALEHPNIEAGLKGLPPEVPHAMRIEKFDRLFRKWSQLVGCAVGGTLQLATDVVWPPTWATEYCERTGQVPRVWRPGPIAEARLLGRFPRQGSNSVWSEGDWIAATREGLEPLPLKLVVPQIGCDVAAGGADYTAIHVRSGCCSLHHEEGNGWGGPEVMARLKELAQHYAHWYNAMLGELPPSQRAGRRPISAREIPIAIDCDGIGTRDVEFLEAEGYRAVRVGAGTKALGESEYPNRRSELWFTVAEMARADELDLSRLPEEVLEECRRQCLSVTWGLDGRGRRVVMPKDEMRRAMGRSPDTADALNLAYTGVGEYLSDAVPQVVVRRRNPLGSW